MRNYFFVFSLLICYASTFAQQTNNVDVTIQLKFGSDDLAIGKTYISAVNDTLIINELRFYLSSFKIHYKDDTTFITENSYHLIDIENSESLKINLKNASNTAIESISFNIGVDSLASVSGAMGGDLDATKGMYWAWQSGFINMKIEGKSSSCKTRKNAFHFHIGGYMSPNYAMRKIEIQVPESANQASNDINLVVDFEKLFSKIHLAETNSIMIPGKEAMEFAGYSSEIFSLK
jgi:hypothetical protein